MLEAIRASAQSTWVKIAFGIIILVFVFWGVGNFNERDYSNVVAVVNGQPIVAIEFEKAYRNAEEYLLRQNPGMTRASLVKDQLGRQVLNDLIRATLLSQEAARTGIAVAPLELAQAIRRMKGFQDEKGKFDPSAYKRVLEAQRTTPAQFEKEVSDQLLAEKLFALVTAPAWAAPEEARARFDYLRESRAVDYIFFPASAYSKGLSVPEAEIKAYYEAHQGEFAVPPKVRIAYVLLEPEALAESIAVDDAEAEKWQAAQKGRFAKPFSEIKAEVRKALALEKAQEQMPEVLDALIEANILNKPLAEGAVRYKLKSGESALLDADALVGEFGIKPEGAKALTELGAGMPLDTALEAGENYLVARVLETKPAGTLPLKEVQGQIASVLKEEKALNVALAKAGEELAQIRKGKSPKDLKSAEPVGRGGALAGFAPDAALSDAIFQSKAGEWLSQAYATQEILIPKLPDNPTPEQLEAAAKAARIEPGALIAKVERIIPADADEWKQVSGLMEQALKRERMEAIFALFVQKLAEGAKIEITNQGLIDRISG